MTATSSLTVAALGIELRRSRRPSGLLGEDPRPPGQPGAGAGDMAIDATDPASGPRMIVHPLPEPGAAKNRLRLVLAPTTTTRRSSG